MADNKYPVVRANSGGGMRLTKAEQQQAEVLVDVMRECQRINSRVVELEKLDRRVRAIESELVRKALPVVRLDGRRGK